MLRQPELTNSFSLSREAWKEETRGPKSCKSHRTSADTRLSWNLSIWGCLLHLQSLTHTNSKALSIPAPLLCTTSPSPHPEPSISERCLFPAGASMGAPKYRVDRGFSAGPAPSTQSQQRCTGSYSKNLAPLSITHLSYMGTKLPATVPL